MATLPLSPVVLSEAKDLTPEPKNAFGVGVRSFASLRMTVLPIAHRGFIQMATLPLSPPSS